MSISSDETRPGGALRRVLGRKLGARLYGRARWLRRPRVVAQILRRLRAFYRNVDSPAPPVAIAWDLHYACNARCAFCGTHERHKKTGGPSGDTATRIAHVLGRAGVPIVGLSGGEPLLSKHFEEVTEILRGYGVEVQLSTNGSHLEKLADRIVRLGVASVTVSVDSLDAAEHDRIRRIQGLHGRLVAGLEALRRHPLAHRVVRRVRLVVTPQNLGQMVAFADFWSPRVDEVCFQPLMHHGELLRGPLANPGFGSELRAPFAAEVARLMDRYPEFRTGYYRGMEGYLFAPAKHQNRFHCLVPTLMLQVYANGDASLCTSDGVIGNILDQGVLGLWNSAESRALRQKSLRRQRACFCYCQWIRANDAIPAWLGERLA